MRMVKKWGIQPGMIANPTKNRMEISQVVVEDD